MMIVSFDLSCSAGINSCSYDSNKVQLISDSELEVAEETEIIADENVNLNGNFSGRILDPERMYILDHNHPGTPEFNCSLAEKRSFNAVVETDDFDSDDFCVGIADHASTISASVSHKSEDDCLNLIGDDEIAIFNPEENNFHDVTLFSPLNSADETGPNDPAGLQSLKALGFVETEGIVDDVFCQVTETERSLNLVSDRRDVSCRKSARIASRTRLERSNSNSDDDEDFKIHDILEDPESGPLKASKSQSCPEQDEEFVPGRELTNSKSPIKRGKRRFSLSRTSRPRSPDSLRTMKQEKNRLAARKCRLKQKLLTDTLVSEVQDEEEKKKTLAHEIKCLQKELLQLQSIMVHHDTLVVGLDGACPIGLAGAAGLS